MAIPELESPCDSFKPLVVYLARKKKARPANCFAGRVKRVRIVFGAKL